MGVVRFRFLPLRFLRRAEAPADSAGGAVGAYHVARVPGSPVVTEPIPDMGQAVLDRISALPRTWVTGDDPIAALHPDRHAEAGRRIRNLIGP